MELRNRNLRRRINGFLTFIAIVLGIVEPVFGESFSPMTPIVQSESTKALAPEVDTKVQTDYPQNSVESKSNTNLFNVSGALKEPLELGENPMGLLLKPITELSVPATDSSDLNNDSSEEPHVLTPHTVGKDISAVAQVNTISNSSQENDIEPVGYMVQKEYPVRARKKAPSTLPDPDIYLPVNKKRESSIEVNSSTSSSSNSMGRESSSENTPVVPEVVELVEKPVTSSSSATPSQMPVIVPPVPVSVPAELNEIPAVASVVPKPTPVYVPKNGEVDGSNPQMYRDDYDYMQLRSELLSEIEKHAWKSGDFQIVPYGYFWASVSYESNPTHIGSCPFYVKSPDNTGNQTHLDYRGSIFGANVLGPRIALLGDAKVRGKIEFDLQRTIDYENKTSLHLRHCYVEAMNEKYRILIGQTWDVVSPLAPGTLLYSAGWQDGNVGYRRAQVRLERFCNMDPHVQIKFQGCLSAPFAGEGTDELNLCGEKYRIKDGSYPIIQGRVATVLGCRKSAQKPIEFGLSGHIGEIQYGHINSGQEDNNYKVTTWGVYFDAYLPINQCIGFQGELFKGENLAMFLGGIGQGAMLGTNQTPEAIQAQGGWMSMWVNITDKLQYRIGYMIDDPTSDYSHLLADSNFSARTLNHSLFTNVKYNITPQWWVGAEYSHIETAWVGKNTGVSTCDRIDLVSYFGF